MYVQKASWLLHILVSFVIRTQYSGICITQHKSLAWHVPSMADNRKHTIRIVGTLKSPPWQAQLGRFLPTISHDNGCRSSFQIVFLFNTKWRTQSRNQAILRVKSLSGGEAGCILNISTRERWMVTFILWLLHQEKNSWYTVNKMADRLFFQYRMGEWGNKQWSHSP